MKNKTLNKKYIVILSVFLLGLILIVICLMRNTKDSPKSIREAHEELLTESQKILNDEVSKTVPVDNSNMEINKTLTYKDEEYSKEIVDGALNEMERVIDLSGYTKIADTKDYSNLNLDEILSEPLHIEYTQQFYFDEIALRDYEKLRLTFSWINVEQPLTEYHLYNEDMTLEYLPIEENFGSIVYVIENVSMRDKFVFYLDAPYLSGVSFVQEEQAVYDSMQFETEEDILSYYGDWILEEETN